MTRNVIALHPEDSLRIVDNTFASHTFHHIPIINTSNRVVGIVSKTDLLQISAIRREFSERDFQYIQVQDFMTREVKTVSPESTLEDVAEIFKSNKFHALPVIENERILGIVTTHDVINAAFARENAV